MLVIISSIKTPIPGHFRSSHIISRTLPYISRTSPYISFVLDIPK